MILPYRYKTIRQRLSWISHATTRIHTDYTREKRRAGPVRAKQSTQFPVASWPLLLYLRGVVGLLLDYSINQDHPTRGIYQTTRHDQVQWFRNRRRKRLQGSSSVRGRERMDRPCGGGTLYLRLKR